MWSTRALRFPVAICSTTALVLRAVLPDFAQPVAHPALHQERRPAATALNVRQTYERHHLDSVCGRRFLSQKLEQPNGPGKVATIRMPA
jgi:hypothetical protein